MTAAGDTLASTVHRLATNAVAVDDRLGKALNALRRGDVRGACALVERARVELWAGR